MAYTTIERVKNNHDRIPAGANYDVEIQQHIDDVDAIIDAKLRGKIDLPFTNTPPLIRVISTDLATYRTLRSLFGAQVDEFHEWIIEYKTASEELLQQVADCSINFDVDNATAFAMIRSATQGKIAIFDLGDVESQNYHPTTGDKRYGVTT